jgi:hypothetical protein
MSRITYGPWGASVRSFQESCVAKDAAWLRMERASAQTMAEEMAARWWGKKDLGEARLSPYTVES